MEYFTAKKIREDWGNKPCNHPKFEKEYFADTHTMDYVCKQCGAEFTILQMFEEKDKRGKLKKQKTLQTS